MLLITISLRNFRENASKFCPDLNVLKQNKGKNTIYKGLPKVNA